MFILYFFGENINLLIAFILTISIVNVNINNIIKIFSYERRFIYEMV